MKKNNIEKIQTIRKKAKHIKSNKKIKAGEVWSINDSKTRGHKSIILKIYQGNVILHDPTTHSPKTRKMKNIKLQKNLDINDSKDAYILPHAFITTMDKLGKKHQNLKVSNSTDKSILRNIKKNFKRKQKRQDVDEC